MKSKLFTVIFFALMSAMSALAQSTAFTYQGSLQNGGIPANGNYDFEFVIFDAQTGGTPQTQVLSLSNVSVVDGVFTVTLDFGPVFQWSPRFLEPASEAAAAVDLRRLRHVGNSPARRMPSRARPAFNRIRQTTAAALAAYRRRSLCKRPTPE